MNFGTAFGFIVFTIVSIEMAIELKMMAFPQNAVLRFTNWLMALNATQAAIGDVLLIHNWVLLPPYTVCAILAWILVWKNRRKGRGKKVAKLIGDKSRAALRRMAGKMRELQPVPRLQPEPV